MSGAAGGAVNSDLLATCAQVAIAVLVVIGIEAAAMHMGARAISDGHLATAIHRRFDSCRHAVQKVVTVVIGMSSTGPTGSLADLNRRVEYSGPLRLLINCGLVAGLAMPGLLPILALIMAIVALWLQARQLEAWVAATTITSVVLAAVLLGIQVHTRAKAIEDKPAPAAPESVAEKLPVESLD
ncbi:hypothetical protein ACQPZX_23435 [Actinoplanes sp. CA-142083]|uniref:hypothetical protein n=1 Tax=Actinoplanes sp. CA-142083 TaxID=3239903 RepID=UPI003D948DB2